MQVTLKTWWEVWHEPKEGEPQRVFVNETAEEPAPAHESYSSKKAAYKYVKQNPSFPYRVKKVTRRVRVKPPKIWVAKATLGLDHKFILGEKELSHADLEYTLRQLSPEAWKGKHNGFRGSKFHVVVLGFREVDIK